MNYLLKQKNSEAMPTDNGTASEINGINLISAYIIAIIGLVISITGEVCIFAGFGGANAPSVGTALALFVCAVFFALAVFSKRILKHSGRSIGCLAVYAAFMLCCATVAYRGFSQVHMLCFYIAAVLSACLFVFKPSIHIPFILVVFGAFYIFLCSVQALGSVNTAEYICVCIVCVLCAVFRYILRINEISATADENRRLKAIAGFDYLTDTKNRYTLEADKPVYFNKPLCIIMCDIDCFKLFNDTYGHQTGDKVIVKAAEILKEYFGKEHTYRYGGDEFLIITNGGEYEKTLQKIGNAIADIKIDGVDKPIECSFGAVCGNAADSEELDKLIYSADKLLYKNKQNAKRQ